MNLLGFFFDLPFSTVIENLFLQKNWFVRFRAGSSMNVSHFVSTFVRLAALERLCEDSTCPQGSNPLNTCIRIWKCLKAERSRERGEVNNHRPWLNLFSRWIIFLALSVVLLHKGIFIYRCTFLQLWFFWDLLDWRRNWLNNGRIWSGSQVTRKFSSAFLDRNEIRNWKRKIRMQLHWFLVGPGSRKE